MSEWPAGARKLLYLFVIVDALATKLAVSEQHQMEWLLQSTMAGRWIQGHLVPRASTPAECFTVFQQLLASWESQGSPTDFASIAKLRASR